MYLFIIYWLIDIYGIHKCVIERIIYGSQNLFTITLLHAIIIFIIRLVYLLIRLMASDCSMNSLICNCGSTKDVWDPLM